MQKTELLEIKKRFKYPDLSFSSMAYAVLSGVGEGGSARDVYTGEGKFLTRDDDEQKSYSSMLSKAFSFSSGVSSLDVSVTGDMKKLFGDYSQKDEHLSFGLSELVSLISDRYKEPGPYSIIIFRDNYDIPIKDEAKVKTGESEEVYQYFALMLCPIKSTKGGLSPDEPSRDIKKSAVLRQLQTPVFGLIYPSFSDRSADYDHAFVCCKGENERGLVTELFSEEVAEPEPVKRVKAEPKGDALVNPPAAFVELSSEDVSADEVVRIVEDVKRGDTENLKKHLLELDKAFKEPYVNNIDDALVSKRADRVDESEEPGQLIEVEDDRSVLKHDKITERDINGQHFLIVPRNILTDELLEELLSLS